MMIALSQFKYIKKNKDSTPDDCNVNVQFLKSIYYFLMCMMIALSQFKYIKKNKDSPPDDCNVKCVIFKINLLFLNVYDDSAKSV